MFKVLIGIIVVAVLIYIGIVAYQRFLLRKITDLQNRRANIGELPVKQKIQEVGDLSLSGSSQVNFNKIESDYSELTDKRLPEIDDIAEHAKQDVNEMKIFEARKDTTAMTDALNAIEADSNRIDDQLENFKKVDQEQHDSVKILRLKYQEFRKSLLAQNLTLGPSIDMLEENLSNLDSDFDNFSQTVDDGDHEKADGQLKILQERTNNLEQQINEIPPLYERLKTTFPEQLEEIQGGYDQLINHNYAFPDDNVRKEIHDLDAKISENTETLANLRLDAVRDNNESISKRIDALYDILQREIDARKDVDNSFPVISEFMTHAEKQNKALLAEIERLDQSYVLDKEDLNESQSLGAQLEALRTEHDRDTEQMTNQPVIYSEILERLRTENEQLKNIEDKQAELDGKFQSIINSEKAARQRLAQYDTEIHNIKRHVENLNLPGVSDEYMDYFFVVSDEIERVGNNMNQVRINIDMILRELDMVNTDLQTLTKKTTDLTDNAALSELAFQYANRYRNNNEDVDLASRRAQKLFDSDYQYEQSFQTISSVLDKVEPGSVENITENYYQQKTTEY
ncbi:septation ring formation regulator EzrA [Pediococcus claussenii]|uniref:Septation ring formation regulator EzrA n=1 Tax=Pediococcus claussenii (strain ATCC BAA-344 / DSM 14800 / JCM 18046 / KCTC 3811 / LMG 21948 / P06) TaxID=701521 RepID=G8PCJ7_PEDCP|nr:septation ring formation regulator EzrA [Pediococcus claussenii]AEV94982.1 Septation ring formation regulator EzrA [Pediococcus claussenii ATCC BAA-344]ANZ70172.1 septation ring formation regulator EzrA [Pediococcus claussenii]ANZ71988.1 septation ring formation regulator EzrA [Pediococcus claussenii]KRN19216.1 ezrA protein [Pediococcus claussenii]